MAISTSFLEQTIDALNSKHFKASTRKIYFSVWRQFNEFFVRLDNKPETWEQWLTLFVGYLIENNKQSQTVRSYISAMRAMLAEVDVFLDDDQFLLAALTRACKFKNDRASMRLPIRKGMLRILLKTTSDFFNGKQQPYLATLYCALISTAYFGLFRVGEITTGSHPVLVQDVHIGRNKKKILFILRTSKTHGVYDPPQSIKITTTKLRPNTKSLDQEKIRQMDIDFAEFYPYDILRHYISERPKYIRTSEPFFVFADNSPVTPVVYLRKLLLFLVLILNTTIVSHHALAVQAIC